MPEWKEHVSLAIPNQTADAFLFLPTAAQTWRLAHFDIKNTRVDLHLLQTAVRQKLNAELTILRWLGNQYFENEEVRDLWSIALMENHSPDWTIPEGAKWVDAQALADLALADEWQRLPLEKAFASLQAPEPVQRPPWFRKAWYRQAKAWMQSELEARDYQLLSPIEQFRQTDLSVILRTDTQHGTIYFKRATAFPLFAHEPKVMSALAELFPKHVPRPLVSNIEERCMLMSDYGRLFHGTNPSQDTLIRLAREYAQLQKQTTSTEMHETLQAAGCFDRRLHILEQQITEVFADESSYAALEAEELKAWQDSRPRLVALCQALAAYKIPQSLMHGDFHGGNIALRGDDLLIFDWTDPCISHPFFDLPVFLDNDGGTAQDELRQAYLAEWQDYETMENLEQAYRLAEVGAALHQVVSYQGIRNGVEEEGRDDWARSVVYFIRQILKALPNLLI